MTELKGEGLFLTALLTITCVTYNMKNNREEMRYLCKVIRSDKVKRVGANGTRNKQKKLRYK